MVVLGNLTQLFCNGILDVVVVHLLASPNCRCLIVSTNESHICPYVVLLFLTNSQSFNRCYFGCWLWVVTTTTTLIGTISCLGGLDVTILKLTSLVLNMFCISAFLRQSPNQ